MGLRTKTFVIIVIIFFSLMLALVLTSRLVILKGFGRIETEYTEQGVGRVMSELSNILSRLDSVAGDWAQWDDTYEFIQNHNRNYIEKNLAVEAFSTLRINSMLFVDLSGQLTFAKAIDLIEVREATLPSDFWDKFISKSTLIDFSGDRRGKTGILMVENTPFLVAARDIVKSDLQGPVKGILIVGKYLDSSEIKKISKDTHLSLTIHPFSRAQIPSDFIEALSLMSDKNPIAVLPLSKSTISGYKIQRDVDNKAAFMLKIDMDRKIYNQGLNTLLYFSLFTLAIGFIFIIATMLLLEKSVLSPLIVLSKSVGVIGENGKLLQRLKVSNKGELGDLELAINMMLDRIQESYEKIKTLEGLIPICSFCKKIRDDKGYWNQVEAYIQKHSGAKFSHGICHECAEEHYPELNLYDE